MCCKQLRKQLWLIIWSEGSNFLCTMSHSQRNTNKLSKLDLARHAFWVVTVKPGPASCYDTRKQILIVSDLTLEFLALKHMPLLLFVCELPGHHLRRHSPHLQVLPDFRWHFAYRRSNLTKASEMVLCLTSLTILHVSARVYSAVQTELYLQPKLFHT
jgi:hypothetical protein